MMRAVLVVFVVFACIWGAAIAFWRIRDVAPGGLQMVLVLGALPLAILGTIVLIRRARAARRDAPAPQAAAPASVDANIGEGPQPPPFAVLAGAVRLASGTDPAAALEALTHPERPGLHPVLRDRDGLPVFAAWIQDLDVTQGEALLAHYAPAARVGTDVARAFALLDTTAEELFLEALAALPAAPDVASRVVAGMHHRQTPQARERIDVQVLVPAAWPTAVRDGCAALLAERAGECGLAPEQVRVEAVAVSAAVDVWRHFERLTEVEVGRRDRWHLVLTADSQLDERRLRAIEAGSGLMSARREDGAVLAEGAAGVLLAPATGGVPAVAALHRPLREETSLASLRAAARATADLMSGALRRADVSADAVTCVLSDADHRPAASIEATSAASIACPELDTATQCPSLGVPNGGLGIVAPIGLLALAAAHVAATSAPVLALSVADERLRHAVAVVPPPTPDHAASPSQSGAESPAAA